MCGRTAWYVLTIVQRVFLGRKPFTKLKKPNPQSTLLIQETWLSAYSAYRALPPWNDRNNGVIVIMIVIITTSLISYSTHHLSSVPLLLTKYAKPAAPGHSTAKGTSSIEQLTGVTIQGTTIIHRDKMWHPRHSLQLCWGMGQGLPPEREFGSSWCCVMNICLFLWCFAVIVDFILIAAWPYDCYSWCFIIFISFWLVIWFNSW